MKEAPIVPRSRSLKKTLSFVHNPIPVFYEYIKDYGDTYYIYMGGIKKCLVTSNPKYIRHILQKNHKNYRKSEIQTDLLAQYIGNGLLSSEGEYWKRQRSLIQPGFHKGRIRNLVTLIQDVVDEQLDHLEPMRGTTVDFYPRMLEVAFRIIGNAMFSTSASGEELNQIEQSIFKVQQFIVKRVRQPFMHPFYWLRGDLKKYKRIASQIDDVILGIIRARKDLGEQPDDLLGMLLNTRYEDTGEQMEEQQILWESNILFVAGHETTANVLSWMLYLLAKHPEKAAKLQREIKAQLGDAALSFESLMQMPYLNAVISETMRMYPPAWVFDRVTKGQDQLDDFNLPADTLVIALAYHAHHDENEWDKPREFNPERFIDNKKPAAYFPFGAGPRMCIGNNFAMLEMQIFLVQFYRRFSVEVVPESSGIIEALITLKPKNGTKLALK